MRVLVDDQLSGRFSSVHETVELRDTEGRTYGYFHPGATPGQAMEISLSSPFSNEEIARRQAAPGGKSLAEIWNSLAGR